MPGLGFRYVGKDSLPSRLSEFDVVAAATLPDSKVPWLELVADYDRIRDLIKKTVPGFEDFNTRVRVPGGFRMPLPPTERKWETPSGKADFYVFKGAARRQASPCGRCPAAGDHPQP